MKATGKQELRPVFSLTFFGFGWRDSQNRLYLRKTWTRKRIEAFLQDEARHYKMNQQFLKYN